MKISGKTKISKLLKANPDVIEGIASINKHFRKLKNPFLRRALAPRVTISDAAKIGGVELNVMLDKISMYGFEIDDLEYEADKNTTEEIERKDFDLDGDIIILDVRPMMAEGKDPFEEIMTATKTLGQDSILKVINTFEPIPLIDILKGKGFKSFVERPEKGIVNTYFRKGYESSTKDEVENSFSNNFEDLKTKFSGNFIEVDVRLMEMPEPMVTILSEIENLKKDSALYVFHKKTPKFLMVELEQRGFTIAEKRVDKNNVHLIIFK